MNLAAGSGYNTVGGNVVGHLRINQPVGLALNSFSEVSLQGGIVNAGDAASLNVEGGHTVVTGGPAPSAGGNVIVKGGTADGSYAGGNIVLQPGTGTPNGTVGWRVMFRSPVSATGLSSLTEPRKPRQGALEVG